MVEENQVYAAIGEHGFSRLAAAFYRQIPGDDILGPMYQGRDLREAEHRLRDFLIFRFGGPQHYIEQRGHPRLRMRHAPFAIATAASERWVRLMDHALQEASLPSAAEAVLRPFFASTAAFLVNRGE